jgi:hypothetical protein
MPLEMHQLVPHQLAEPVVDVKSKLQATSEVCEIIIIALKESILIQFVSFP